MTPSQQSRSIGLCVYSWFILIDDCENNVPYSFSYRPEF